MALEDLAPHLPRFTGSDPTTWISQSELYFRFYSIYGDERFSYIIEVFEDEPFYWFNSWFRSDDLTWNDFTNAILNQFDVGALDDHQTELITTTSSISVISDDQQSMISHLKHLNNEGTGFTDGIIDLGLDQATSLFVFAPTQSDTIEGTTSASAVNLNPTSVQVNSNPKSIFPAKYTNQFKFGSSFIAIVSHGSSLGVKLNHGLIGHLAHFLVGYDSNFRADWLEGNFAFDPCPTFVHMASSNRITSMYDHIATSLLASPTLFLDHMPIFIALPLLNFALPYPKLFVLDHVLDPHDPYTTLTLDSIQLHLYKDSQMFEPICKFWKSYIAIVEMFLPYGANNWLLDTKALVVPNFEWKPGWHYGLVVKVRETLWLTDHYCFYYHCATTIIAAQNWVQKNYLICMIRNYMLPIMILQINMVLMRIYRRIASSEKGINYCHYDSLTWMRLLLKYCYLELEENMSTREYIKIPNWTHMGYAAIQANTKIRFLLNSMIHINPKHPLSWIAVTNKRQNRMLYVQSSRTSFSSHACELDKFLKVGIHVEFTYSAQIFMSWVLAKKKQEILFVVSVVRQKLIASLHMHVRAESTYGQQGRRQVVDAIGNMGSASPTKAAIVDVIPDESTPQSWLALDDDLIQKVWRIHRRIIKVMVPLMWDHNILESLVMFHQLLNGLAIDAISCSSAFLACVNIGEMKQNLELEFKGCSRLGLLLVQEIVVKLMLTGESQGAAHINPILTIVMHAKYDAIAEAFKVFNLLQSNDMLAWNNILMVMAMHGHDNNDPPTTSLGYILASRVYSPSSTCASYLDPDITSFATLYGRQPPMKGRLSTNRSLEMSNLSGSSKQATTKGFLGLKRLIQLQPPEKYCSP